MILIIAFRSVCSVLQTARVFAGRKDFRRETTADFAENADGILKSAYIRAIRGSNHPSHLVAARRAGFSVSKSRLLALSAVLLAAPLAAQDRPPANPLREPAAEKLPWEKDSQKKSRPNLRPIAGPREFLMRYGIVASQWDSFLDGQPLSAAEEEVVVRLLHLYSRFGQDNVEAWADRQLAPQALTESADEHRGQIVRLTGKAVEANLIKLIPEAITRFEFSNYYQLRLSLAEGTAVLYCRELPAAWKVDAPLDENVAAYGLFIKTGDEQASSPLLLVTDRVAWLPLAPRAKLKVTPAHVALASLGVDIGRLQLVGQERRTGLTAVDREPFYQVLSALGDERATTLVAASPPLELPPLLQAPTDHAGEVHRVHGLARRVLRVDVPDADIRRRFGIDHYYEIDLSLPLEQTIKLGADPQAKNEAVVYENSFPATICVRELPPGLATGDDVRQSISASAVFFKVWLYSSGYTKDAGLAQPAPLFLARTVNVESQEQPSTWVADVIVGTAMALIALTFVGIILWYRWSDRRTKPVPTAVAGAKPDFSDLR